VKERNLTNKSGDRGLILRLIHYNGDGQSGVKKQMLVGFLFVNPTYEAAAILIME
jgi:hypothetical protein